jgi:hypothetical protein
MLKFAATLLLVYSLLIVLIAAPAHAQPQVRPDESTVAELPKKQPANTTVETKFAKKKIDFKKIIDEETKKFYADSAKFDPIKIELEKAKQAQKKRWTQKDTALMVLLAVGIAVGVYLLIKYGKKCIEASSPNCTPGVDEGCYCERYEENDNRNRGIR